MLWTSGKKSAACSWGLISSSVFFLHVTVGEALELLHAVPAGLAIHLLPRTKRVTLLYSSKQRSSSTSVPSPPQIKSILSLLPDVIFSYLMDVEFYKWIVQHFSAHLKKKTYCKQSRGWFTPKGQYCKYKKAAKRKYLSHRQGVIEKNLKFYSSHSWLLFKAQIFNFPFNEKFYLRPGAATTDCLFPFQSISLIFWAGRQLVSLTSVDICGNLTSFCTSEKQKNWAVTLHGLIDATCFPKHKTH